MRLLINTQSDITNKLITILSQSAASRGARPRRFAAARSYTGAAVARCHARAVHHVNGCGIVVVQQVVGVDAGRLRGIRCSIRSIG